MILAIVKIEKLTSTATKENHISYQQGSKGYDNGQQIDEHPNDDKYNEPLMQVELIGRKEQTLLN